MDYHIRRQKIAMKDGLCCWETIEEEIQYPASETALVIVDMWDKHWCTGANIRGAPIAEKINAAANRARDKGILVVHAPSDTMDFYEGTEARKRILSVPRLNTIPEPVPVAEQPLPIDDTDGGSDTADQYAPNTKVWTRQTDKIKIDQGHDIICGDEGDLLFSYLYAKGIKLIIYMGVHTNMCILNRSFAIKKMLKRGMLPLLVRDLTDAMYNPAMLPYVSHDEGTVLVINYIEKFYCPTIDSSQL
ncbi:isochorismatase family protein [Leadbettera azotonutricia]|uniref:Isochorismatase hydrolase n=1 Tax=Leadbettera azotonutricia (strain ATCC BAA-888 / DSM 13862 / ZAS-9) TaxID=545695 RepID=F5YED1_LEAAZ|nr:isochorismatase family protein [Leadbettera azotonutricia]AEF80699.1 isochorismatase hydrolase [Leadbettera azotonutricia ZAS-9]